MKLVFLFFIFFTNFFLITNCFPEIIFSDIFKGVSVTFPNGSSKLYPDPDKWVFTFLPGTKWPDSYGDGTNWLNANKECQTYITPFITQIKGDFIPRELRYDPFEIKEDGLHIRASLLTKEQRSVYKTEVPYRRFGSGMLLSKKSFLFGKFSLIGKMPKAKGSWPAFWLLPASFKWPPEIDIFEIMAWGRKTRDLHSGFFPIKSEGKPSGRWYKVNQSLNEEFNKYTLDWKKDKTSVFFNGDRLWTAATPDSLKEPMYMLITLTIGGNWPFNELQVLPIDCKSNSRLSRGSDIIEDDYPDSLILRSVIVEKN